MFFLCEMKISARLWALLLSDARISRVNAGLGRSMKSSKLTKAPMGKTSLVRRNFLLLDPRLQAHEVLQSVSDTERVRTMPVQRDSPRRIHCRCDSRSMGTSNETRLKLDSSMERPGCAFNRMTYHPTPSRVARAAVDRRPKALEVLYPMGIASVRWITRQTGVHLEVEHRLRSTLTSSTSVRNESPGRSSR